MKSKNVEIHADAGPIQHAHHAGFPERRGHDVHTKFNWIPLCGDLNPAEVMVSETERSELAALERPSQITGELVHNFIDRWNRTQDYWSRGILNAADVPAGESDDFIAVDIWHAKLADARDAALANESEGYVGLFDGIDAGMTALQESLSDSDAVCARVRIEVKQEAVITRNAFEASLELDNASADGTSITLHVYGGEMDHCNVFEPEPNGAYRRVTRSLSYHD